MHAQYYLNICYFKWTLYLLCQNYPFKTGKNTSSNPLGISASPSHLCSSPNHQTANSYGYYSVTSQRTNLKFPFGFTSCSDSTHLTSFCRIFCSEYVFTQFDLCILCFIHFTLKSGSRALWWAIFSLNLKFAEILYHQSSIMSQFLNKSLIAICLKAFWLSLVLCKTSSSLQLLLISWWDPVLSLTHLKTQ